MSHTTLLALDLIHTSQKNSALGKGCNETKEALLMKIIKNKDDIKEHYADVF